MWSVANRVLVFIPTNSGEPRRDATHSPGKYRDLNAKAKAPSYSVKKFHYLDDNDRQIFN